VHQQWLDLFEGERLAWSKSAYGYKFQNRLGKPYSLSGFNLFRKIMLAANAEGWPDPAEPPIMQRSVPPDSQGFVLDAGPPDLYLIDWVNPATAGSGNLNVWFSRPWSTGAQNFFTRWWGPTSITPKGNSLNFKAMWLAHWSAAIEGERVGIMISFWDPPYLPSQIVRMAGTVL